jgi:fumarylacetoacetase
MTNQIDHTHDPALKSWVQSANGHPDFPIQNLPLGVFSIGANAPRIGIAIGDHILDVESARLHLETSDTHLLAALNACATPPLNALLALGAAARRALRHAASALLANSAVPRPELLHAAADCALHLPTQIGDYTDLYAGIHHATNIGKLFRPDAPLLPNYKYIPIGYHGRASSVRPSGEPVRRPHGQRKNPNDAAPIFGPSERLDYELELGIWIGPGNDLGSPIPIADAAHHIAGYSLLNDWSARDLQTWEYQPLGPFLAKSFHTTISPWIITPEALAPFRVPQPPRPDIDPQSLPYLQNAHDQSTGALNLTLEVYLLTQSMRAQNLPPHRLSVGPSTNLYWTPAQMLTHHASNGCNLRPGDLLGTGTISTELPEGYGSLIELTQAARLPIQLPTAETRTFLHDGDEIILRAQAAAPGHVTIGLGQCRAVIT